MRRRAEHRTNLQLAFVGRSKDIRMDLHELSPALDRLFFRFQVEDGESSDQFFRLSEWSIDDRCFSACNTDAHSLGTGQKSPSGYHGAARCCLLSKFCDGPHSVQDSEERRLR